MSSSTLIYIAALMVFAAGIWLIVEFGSVTLHAQEDLAGEWELSPQTPLPDQVAARMKIEQSGRFFKITFPDGTPVNMKLAGESLTDSGGGARKQIVLNGGGEEAVFLGEGEQWRLSCSGRVQGNWSAYLVDRAYPKSQNN